MSRKEWIAVVVVIGVGIVWQIPRHEDAMPTDQGDHLLAPAPTAGAGSEDGPPPGPADAAAPYRRIALEVTGMT